MENIGVPKKVGRLDEITLKKGLERSVLEFEADEENPVNSGVARLLWHKAVLRILQVHGEAGSRAITLMGIFCLFSSKILHFRVNEKAVSALYSAAEILVRFGLLKSFRVYYHHYSCPDRIEGPFIKVELACLTMAKAIRNVNLPIERRILEECFKCLVLSSSKECNSNKEYLEVWDRVLEHGDLYLEIDEYSISRIREHFEYVVGIWDQNLFLQMPLLEKILAKYKNHFGSTDPQTAELKEIYMKMVFFSTVMVDEGNWEQWIAHKGFIDHFHCSGRALRPDYRAYIAFRIVKFLNSQKNKMINPELKGHFLNECVRLNLMVISGLDEEEVLDEFVYIQLIYSICELGATTQLPKFIRKFRERIQHPNRDNESRRFLLYSLEDFMLVLDQCFDLAVKDSDRSVNHNILEELVKFLQLVIELCYESVDYDNPEFGMIHKATFLLIKTFSQLEREADIRKLLASTHDLRFRVFRSRFINRHLLKLHLEIELIRILGNRSS